MNGRVIAVTITGGVELFIGVDLGGFVFERSTDQQLRPPARLRLTALIGFLVRRYRTVTSVPIGMSNSHCASVAQGVSGCRSMQRLR